MTLKISLCLLVLQPFLLSALPDADSRLDPDFNRNIKQLITSRGFWSEEHKVTTKDGYILTHYRILHPEYRDKPKGRPVILQHGLMSTGHDFIINSPGGHVDEPVNEETPGNNLGFELAKRGFDVWLTNSRGNTYARAHKFLSPDMGKQFWDFSFDQMIEQDMPATIDYILSVTKKKTVAYVGHSQGTTISFGLLSENKKYNDILKPVIALAPVATVGHIATPFRHLARMPFLNGILSRVGGEFLPNNGLVKTIAERLCTSRIKSICSNIMFLGNGFSAEQLNASRVAVYASHYPAGTSARNMLHFSQGVRTGRFAKYDFGPKKNQDMYNSTTAPEYKLENITSKDIVLFSADNDWLAPPADVSILLHRLKGHVLLDYKVPVKDFNHLDFLIARDAGFFVNKKLIQILRKYDDLK